MLDQLNERIAALRKERGFTLEQLGQMVGVSAQAVSKWEKGGAPDVSLLPAVADALGVSIDALFGRQNGEKIDITETVRRWIVTVPPRQRMDRLCELVWSAASMVADDGCDPDASDHALFSGKRERTSLWGYPSDSGEILHWIRRNRVVAEEGLILGLRAEELSWVGIFPEPEAGWDSALGSNVQYRRLFELLSRPHCLELLEYLNSKPPFTGRYHTPESIAETLGLELPEADALLEALTEMRLLFRAELEAKGGLINCYKLHDHAALVPFLYTSLWLLAEDGGNSNVTPRKGPVLRGEKWKEKEN